MLRLLARCWFRDGEVLVKHVSGTHDDIDHGTLVPYSVEMIEADFLPFDMVDSKRRIIHGVQKNKWQRPRAYYLYKEHPGDLHSFVTQRDTVRFAADRILHLKMSERMAAKVAASICAYIRKSLDGPTGAMAMDDAGNRPNTMLQQFRNSQLRAVAARTCTSFSSIAKDYNGTYSAQRQELVEQSVHYAVLRDYFIERCVRPIWERFVDMALLSKQLEMPDGSINKQTLKKAGFQGPNMPWIDPKKEGEAEMIAVGAGFKSRAQVIRERGGNPQDVFEQIKQEREQEKETGISFSTSQPSNNNSNGQSQENEDKQDDESKEDSGAGESHGDVEKDD